LQIGGKAQPRRNREVVEGLYPAFAASVNVQRGESGKQGPSQPKVEETNAPAVVLAARQQIVSSEASKDAPFDRAGITV